MEANYAHHHPPGGSFPYYNPEPKKHQDFLSEDADSVPFGRSRNRRTMKELDFLLQDVTERYPSLTSDEFILQHGPLEEHDDISQHWNIDDLSNLDDDSTTMQNKQARLQMQRMLLEIQKSQKIHEMKAPRLVAHSSQAKKTRSLIRRRKSFDSATQLWSVKNGREHSRLPSVSLSGRDDARLLCKAYESLLSRWSRQVPGSSPKTLIKQFIKDGNVEATIQILEPEVRILKATMNSLQQQITSRCVDQGDLMGRVEARYRRTIRILLKLAHRVNILKTRVAQRIPKIEQGRKIMTDCIQTLRLQVEATIEAGDGRADRSKFQDALTRLINNTRNMPKNTEAKTMRMLEKAVDTLKRGRIEAEDKLVSANRELVAFKLAHEETMLRVQSDIKVLQKTITSLKRNEGMTRKNRDDQINKAMEESFQRAQAVAAGSLERLQKENNRLQTTVTTIKRQLTQQQFQQSIGFSAVGVQCDLSKEEEEEAAKRIAVAEKKAAKRGRKVASKKKRTTAKKKKKEDSDKDAIGEKTADDKNNKDVGDDDLEEHTSNKIDKEVAESEKPAMNLHDKRVIEQLKNQVHNMTHILLEKEAQIQYLQQLAKGGSETSGRIAASKGAIREASAPQIEPLKSDQSKKALKTAFTQYEENPVPMKSAKTEEGGQTSGRKKRPRRKKRTAIGGGSSAQQAPPDPKADLRWARSLMSIACAAACAAPKMGGFSPEKSFNKVFRCELFRIYGSQGFADIVMCILYTIVRKRVDDCRMIQIFARLLGILPVRSMETDDTGLSSEDTVLKEYTALVLGVMAHACHHSGKDEMAVKSDTEIKGRPLLVPPEAASHRLSLSHSKHTVAYICKCLKIPGPMIKGYQKSLDEIADGHSKEHAVDVVDIIDLVESAWRDQYARRKVQLGAQYSMASATTNWFHRVDACQALCKIEPIITPQVADEVFCDAVEMMRSHTAVTSSNSSTKMNPGVSVRTFMPALIKASWMHMKGPPRWIPSPQRVHGGEDLLTLVNETMAALPRHMAGLMQKHSCKPLRKLLIRMKHELKDSLSSLHEHAWGSHEYLHTCQEHGERLVVLLQEIGSFVVGQDEATVRKTLKDLTGR